jgi:hypothetical protein
MAKKKVAKKKVSKKINKLEEVILSDNNDILLENTTIVEPEKQLEIVESSEKKKKGSAMKYADKKKLAIEHAKYFVSKYESDSNYLDFFNKHKKKDDLADSFLQGLYYFKNKC